MHPLGNDQGAYAKASVYVIPIRGPRLMTSLLDISGWIVTLDAMRTQTEISKTVIEGRQTIFSP